MKSANIEPAALSPVQPLSTDTDIGSAIHGSWQLETYEVEVQSNGERFAPMGEHPSGYVLFTPQGRLSFTLTSGHRQPPESLEDKAALLSSVIAYTGTYRLDGDRWITQVDVAWNPEWVGTEQIRHFKIHGDQLTVTTPWRVMPNWPDKGLTRSIVRFYRCQN